MIQKNHRPVLVHNRRVVIVRHINDLMPVIRDWLIMADFGNQSVPMAIRFNRSHQTFGSECGKYRGAKPAAAKLHHRPIGMFQTRHENRNMSRKGIHDCRPHPTGLIRSTAFCQVGDIKVPCITCDLAM